MKLLGVSLSLCLVLTMSQAFLISMISPNYTEGPPSHSRNPPNYTESPPSLPTNPPVYTTGLPYHPKDIFPSTEGLCDKQKQNCGHGLGSFCPKCDDQGNFLPQQCSGSTGYCWCVDVVNGETILNTTTTPGMEPVNCGNSKDEDSDEESVADSDENFDEDSDEDKENDKDNSDEESNEDSDENSDEDSDENSDEDSDENSNEDSDENSDEDSDENSNEDSDENSDGENK